MGFLPELVSVAGEDTRRGGLPQGNFI